MPNVPSAVDLFLSVTGSSSWSDVKDKQEGALISSTTPKHVHISYKYRFFLHPSLASPCVVFHGRSTFVSATGSHLQGEKNNSLLS